MNKPVFLLLLLSLLLHLSISSPKSLVLFEQQESLLGSHSDIDHYLLPITKKIDGQYLIITAEGTLSESEPDIFINLDGFYDGEKTAKYECKSYGFALCYVHSNDIAENSLFYVSIKCHSRCGYKINALYEEEKDIINMKISKKIIKI